MRSEGNRLLEAVDELIRISREAGIPAEIYHLKAAGKANWAKMDAAIAAIEKARREGLKITADMYNVSGRRDRTRRRDASLGPRRRLRGGLQAAEGPRDAQEDRARDRDAVAATGKTSTSPPAPPIACCSSSSNPTR